MVFSTGWYPGLLFLRSRFQLENEFIFRPKHDPDKPPPAQPGDIIIVFAALVGVIVFATAGTIFGLKTWIISPYFGFATGTITGGITGTLVGDRIKKAILRRRERFYDNKEP